MDGVDVRGFGAGGGLVGDGVGEGAGAVLGDGARDETVTIVVILSIVDFGTPAFERSATDV